MKLQKAERFIAVAKAIADLEFDSDMQFRHVSIIIKNKSIVGIGTNVYKTHTFNRRNGYLGDSLHSEVSAYGNIKYKDGPFVLLNFRFNKHGELRMSKPCEYCMPFCMEIFNEIWYSTDEGMMKHDYQTN